MYGCYFYNFGYTVEFDTYDAAEQHGKDCGFQYTVVYLGA